MFLELDYRSVDRHFHLFMRLLHDLLRTINKFHVITTSNIFLKYCNGFLKTNLLHFVDTFGGLRQSLVYSGHLCITANFVQSLGWSLYTGSTVYIYIHIYIYTVDSA